MVKSLQWIVKVTSEMLDGSHTPLFPDRGELVNKSSAHGLLGGYECVEHTNILSIV